MGPLKLTEDRQEALVQAQRVLHDLLPQLDQLEQCGEDCKAQRHQLQKTHANISKLLQFFGGNHPQQTMAEHGN